MSSSACVDSSSTRSAAPSDLQHVHARARQQRADDLERRILGGRADERQRAVLDVRQEGVLLRLVEAMHLVEEQHGRLAALARATFGPARPRRGCPSRRPSPPTAAGTARRRDCAMRRASVVLPVPGGPQRIIECSWPRSSACRSGLPGASRCSCPTNSSSVRGRMRSASGRMRVAHCVRGLQQRARRHCGPAHRAASSRASSAERRRRSHSRP